MRVVRFLPTLLLSLLLCTCGDRPIDEDGAGVDTPEDTAPDLTPNDGNLDIYDVDPEDPYLVSNGVFLGLKPGEPLAPYTDALRKGKLRTGEGKFDVYYIDGAEGNELGYTLADPNDENKIGDIYITSPAVVTEAGIRVGLTYAELTERLGTVAFHGSEQEGRVYGEHEELRYRLGMESGKRNLTEADIEPATEVTEIVIHR